MGIDLSRIMLQRANIKKDWARVDNFIQITVFCPPKPRVGAFVYRNAGKVYETSHSDYLLSFNRITKSRSLNDEVLIKVDPVNKINV